ncbi:MAG: hypothetical protein GXO89_14500 [Chlorobi bacterium]|nr:hypothetical protein [Chlorobiota bacterium]
MGKLSFSRISDIYKLVFLSLLVKVVLLPFAQTDDADAVTRIFISIDWMNDPTWIKTAIWAPFHFYLNGVALMVWDNPVFVPKIVNILFSSFTLIPFYAFTKREFNKDGALAASAFLAISPVLFRNGFLALSETPYLFFLVLTMDFISKGLKGNSVRYMVLAGFFITIAAGFRYEAWLVMAIFGLLILLLGKWKQSIVFGFVALLFPVIWMYSNWLETGDALYSIHGNYHYTLVEMGNNDNVGLESRLRRIWFFPFSWMIALGPPVAFLVLKTMIGVYKKRPAIRSMVFWSVPFWVMLLFFLYNASKGVLLLQHRFTGTLVVFSLPFIAIYFKELNPKRIRQAWVFGLITVAFSFVYNTSNVTPLPRLEDQSGVAISNVINKSLVEGPCLIIDFIGWQNTYFIALHSGLPQNEIVIVGGAKNSTIPIKGIHKIMESFDHGLIVLEKGSRLSRALGFDEDNCSFVFENYKYQTEMLLQKKEVLVMSWGKNAKRANN